MSDQSAFGYGQIFPDDTSHDINAWVAIARALIARIDTMKLVKVMAVNPGSGTPPTAGTVNVLPLVSQIDGNGYSVEHGTVNGIPYFRLGGAVWQVVVDPAVGEYGYVVCADRDSSNVVKNPGQQVPGSRRKHNIADGVYVGGVLNGAPKAWFWLKPDGTWQLSDQPGNVLQGDSNGIEATPISGMPFKVNGNAAVTGNLLLQGNILSQTGSTYGGNISTSGNVIAGAGGADQIGLQTHKHGGVQTGGGESAAPVAGT